jgi:hypothetical protein
VTLPAGAANVPVRAERTGFGIALEVVDYVSAGTETVTGQSVAK